MKIIISPAKSLDFQKELPTNEFSMPLFLNDSISICIKLFFLFARKMRLALIGIK